MISMFFGALFTAVAAEPGDLKGFKAQVTEAMLAGETLSADHTIRLNALAPVERIEMIVFLRRSGMMKGPTWPIEDLLRPAEKVD